VTSVLKLVKKERFSTRFGGWQSRCWTILTALIKKDSNALGGVNAHVETILTPFLHRNKIDALCALLDVKKCDSKLLEALAAHTKTVLAMEEFNFLGQEKSMDLFKWLIDMTAEEVSKVEQSREIKSQIIQFFPEKNHKMEIWKSLYSLNAPDMEHQLSRLQQIFPFINKLEPGDWNAVRILRDDVRIFVQICSHINNGQVSKIQDSEWILRALSFRERPERIRILAQVLQGEKTFHAAWRVCFPLFANTIDVHNGSREGRTKDALKKIIESENQFLSNDAEYYFQNFENYLKSYPTQGQDSQQQASRKEKALRAEKTLYKQPDESPSFGPIISGDDKITLYDLNITGKELIGRLWKFIDTHTLTITNPITADIEKENYRSGFINALAASFEKEGERLCTPGILQHLVVALPGNTLDVPKPTTSESLHLFFLREDIRNITSPRDLRTQAETYLDENPDIVKSEFTEGIENYIQNSLYEEALNEEVQFFLKTTGNEI